MTESDWRDCSDTQRMLEFIRKAGNKSDRKLRLFACACIRRVWDLLIDERSCKLVEFAECLEESAATRPLGAKRDAHDAAANLNLQVSLATATDRRRLRAQSMAATAASLVMDESKVFYFQLDATEYYAVGTRQVANAVAVAVKLAARAEGRPSRPSAKHEQKVQCQLLRCIFGNLPHSVWQPPHDDALVAQAKATYSNRILPQGTFDPADMESLSHALVEAGCQDSKVLNHCTQPGSHVRGCWVIDLILGKK